MTGGGGGGGGGGAQLLLLQITEKQFISKCNLLVNEKRRCRDG